MSRVRIRRAAARDVDMVADLIALTDAPREDTMMDTLEQEIVGEALRAGLDRGIPALHLGYKLVYGQMPANPGLETFYRRHGFDVLAPGEGLDLSHLFGIPSRLSCGPDHQVFTHWQRAPP